MKFPYRNSCLKKTILKIAVLCLLVIHLVAQVDDPSSDVAFTKKMESITALSGNRKTEEFIKLIRLTDLLSSDSLAVHAKTEYLRPPKEMMTNGHGWIPWFENDMAFEKITGGNKHRLNEMQKMTMIWTLFLMHSPTDALTSMLPRINSSNIILVDALRLMASMDKNPGEKLKNNISKELWSQFYNSPNPCYKILALEKYDSTEQSPAELLKLYRECLFNAFGYLQVRALEGIYSSKDFRPEVKALLKEFLASNPVVDDGTLPAFPARISNPVDGAKWLLAEMEKPPEERNKSSAISQKEIITPSSKTSVIPKSTVTTTSTNKSTPAESDQTDWLLWSAIIIGTLNLMVMMFKKKARA